VELDLERRLERLAEALRLRHLIALAQCPTIVGDLGARLAPREQGARARRVLRSTPPRSALHQGTRCRGAGREEEERVSTVEDGKVVSIEYVLRDSEGRELDRSREGEPLVYLHGARNIVPGLEEALTGKSAGDRVEVRVPPEKGFGPKGKVKPQAVLRSRFPEEAQVVKGARFVAEGPGGRPTPIWVHKVQGKTIYVTPEHPLAGVTLCFDVTIRAIRDATDEERAHGHAHGPDGHAHHD
jgi:FKBP-type peptidyl-prolyl cis-trans isomerase SlyD